MAGVSSASSAAARRLLLLACAFAAVAALDKSAVPARALVASDSTSDYEPLCQINGPPSRPRCEQGGVPAACPQRSSDSAKPTGTGAWALADDYVYYMDRGLVGALVKLLSGRSVVELGAGRGCYTRALLRHGVAASGYDGAPDIVRQTRGLIGRADLTTELGTLGCADYAMSFEV